MRLNTHLLHTPVPVHVRRLIGPRETGILEPHRVLRVPVLPRLLQTAPQRRPRNRVQRGPIGHAGQGGVHRLHTSPVHRGGYAAAALRVVIVRYSVRLPRGVCHRHPVSRALRRTWPAVIIVVVPHISEAGIIVRDCWPRLTVRHRDLCGISVCPSGKDQIVDGHHDESYGQNDQQDLEIEGDASCHSEALPRVSVVCVDCEHCGCDYCQQCWNWNEGVLIIDLFRELISVLISLTCDNSQDHLHNHIHHVTADDCVPGRDHGHLHNRQYAKDPQANAADCRHYSSGKYGGWNL